MAGKKGFGTKFGYYVSTTLTNIADVTRIRPYNLKADTIDVTSHDSTDEFREKIAGLKDAGQVSVDLNYDPGAATHQWLEAEIGASHTFKITFATTPARVATFTGFLNSVGPEAPHDNKMSCTASVEITGKIAWGTT